MNRLGRPQLPAPWAICGSNSKQIDRGVPEIRDLGYFKRINGLRFWCLQNPLKIATFWDPPNFAKSCPANFAAVKKFRVRNNEHVAPSKARLTDRWHRFFNFNSISSQLVHFTWVDFWTQVNAFDCFTFTMSISPQNVFTSPGLSFFILLLYYKKRNLKFATCFLEHSKHSSNRIPI